MTWWQDQRVERLEDNSAVLKVFSTKRVHEIQATCAFKEPYSRKRKQ